MSADSLHYKSITEISELIRRKEAKPSEITEAMLGRIAKLDGQFHGYALVLAERAMAQAKQYDAEIAKGIWRGPLHGVPIGLKDLCYTSFAPTAGGTTIHAKFVPSFNATIVDRLEVAGAVTLGKLKMTEGAYTSHHPAIQAPLNPWNVNYWVGSSSTGSGVATSAGLCYGAIGSDTGGSIRFPSATCGLTGIKPTWGRVSRHGVFPLADSLDHVGPMCRSAADAAAMLGVIAGADINDPTALRAPVPNYLAGIDDGIRGLRIGVDRRYTQEGIDRHVVAALVQAERTLADLGADIREVHFPPYQKLVSQWIAMCSVETAEAHLDTYPSRKSEYGPDLAPADRAGPGDERRRYCRDPSRAAEVQRQPRRHVRRYRSAADPDDAGADSDADQDERIRRRPQRAPEHSALHGGVRLLRQPDHHAADGHGLGPDAAQHAIGRPASLRGRPGPRRRRVPVGDGLAYAAAADRIGDPQPVLSTFQNSGTGARTMSFSALRVAAG
ncbi:Asp-tRNA(Asn)/Glu-tRNA(Gln) amidotransferase A subunit family amidase [Bradyrhizobium elkanii]